VIAASRLGHAPKATASSARGETAHRRFRFERLAVFGDERLGYGGFARRRASNDVDRRTRRG
jgi:hypothetical protein